MRKLQACLLSVGVAGVAACATAPLDPASELSQYDAQACQQKVDATFASSLLAPSRGNVGLCNAGGGMTMCRGQGSSFAGREPMKPVSSHEEDSRIMFDDCVAERQRRRDAVLPQPSRAPSKG